MTKLQILRLISQTELLKHNLRKKIESIGTRESARIIGMNHAYISKVRNGAVNISFESAAEMMLKICGE